MVPNLLETAAQYTARLETEIERLRADNVDKARAWDAVAIKNAEIERLRLELICAKPLYSRRKLEENNKWLVERLRDAVNTCYGGTTHEDIDTHEQREDTNG